MPVFVRRLLAATLTGVMAVAGLVTPASAATEALTPAEPGTRAMWLWTSANAKQVIAWASSHGVSEIFVAVNSTNISRKELRRLKALRSGADREGIRLTALGGAASWATDPEAALAWQRAALGTGVFSGSHVDIEPYLLAGWETDQQAIVASYLDVLTRLQADDPRPLEVDVPFWIAQIPSGQQTLADAVLARVDAMTAMTYRDTAWGPNGLMAVAYDLLGRATAADIPLRLAVETQPLADCPYCTFYEEGSQAMTEALATVDREAASYPAFAGVAVHHYNSWVALTP